MIKFVSRKTIYYFIFIILFLIVLIFLKNTFVRPIIKTNDQLAEQLDAYDLKIKQIKKELALKNNDYSKLFQLYFKNLNKFDFKLSSKKKLVFENQTYTLKTFTNNIFFDVIRGKHIWASGSAYIEKWKDNIILTTGEGLFIYLKSSNLIDTSKIDAYKIVSNIYDLVNKDNIINSTILGIKDTYVLDDYIYVSYTAEINDGCYNTSILRSKLSLEKLNFKIFFKPDECVKYNNNHFGGRITYFKDNKLLLTVGEVGKGTGSQDLKNYFGSIVSINIDKFNDSNEQHIKDYEIISFGHRNPQGLHYNKNKNLIFETEHGPDGGDEFNIIDVSLDLKSKNYGWPEVNYGKTSKFKQHEKYKFVEPIKYWTPSIAISEIIEAPKFIYNNQNTYMISSMGNKLEEGDMTLHLIELDNNNKSILNYKTLEIGERIRDIKFIDKENVLLMFLENTPGIGILSND